MVFIRIVIFSLIVLFVGYEAQAGPFNESFRQVQEKLALGHLHEARGQLQQLSAAITNDSYALTALNGLQGYLALQQRDTANAERLLKSALAQAQKQSWPDLAAHFALYLGQLNEQQQQPVQTQQFFALALAQASQAPDQSLQVSSLCSLANLAMADQNFALAEQYLTQGQTLLDGLANNPSSGQLWLTIGYQTLQLYQHNPRQNDYLQAAFSRLQHALTQARDQSQFRLQASSLNHLATLYKHQQQPQEAIKLLLEGIRIAQKTEANDLLIDLQWQLGELYKAENQPQPAIAAYRQALKQLETIRLDIPVTYQKGRSSFKATFAPLYLGLADLLLQQAPLVPAQPRQDLLQEARDTIELMKKSELEDYFQSRCEIPASPINLQKTDRHAAAIYPISLPDRLEIMVYTADGLHQFTQAVTAAELTRQARAFSAQLRNPFGDSDTSKQQAQQLYHWLIGPIRPLLAKQQIETLLYIPDGVLRLIPLAALYTGQNYLIEDYAVVTSTGMSLIDSNTIHDDNQDMLLAGMSKPGDVVTDLPTPLLNELFAAAPSDQRQISRDLKLRSGQPQPTEITAEKTRELRDLLKNKAVLELLKAQLALPGVETEIKQLASQNAMPYLLNESFSLAHFTEQASTQPHKILHLASHGIFGATAEDSFIMTYDKVLNMNQLEALLSADYFKRHPIDLITLSACQTAEGDDRSPLGISGIAIKAKVRSALGSLWSVSDEATAQLMSTFYQALKTPGLGKAKALQQAEIKLLKQKEFNNPSFWSPFILVGNWL